VWGQSHRRKTPAASTPAEPVLPYNGWDEKRETVLLYYFFDMSEREIATYCNIPRTTVQTRRTSSMKLLKRYLEEHAYDYKG